MAIRLSLKAQDLKAIIKAMELADEPTTLGRLAELMEDDTITINECRNGHRVVWYMRDEYHQHVIDCDTLAELTDEEIETELL